MSTMRVVEKSQIVTLHKYFLNASCMKKHFEATLSQQGAPKNISDLPDLMTYLSLWYSCLRVVIEGWQCLGLSDPDVEPCLISEKIELLNGFRNDTFHFKKDYFSSRTQKLLNDQGFVKWVRTCHDAIGDALLTRIKQAD